MSRAVGCYAVLFTFSNWPTWYVSAGVLKAMFSRFQAGALANYEGKVAKRRTAPASLPNGSESKFQRAQAASLRNQAKKSAAS